MELELEVGKFYKTRGGYKVRIDATDYAGNHPVSGLLIANNKRQGYNWTSKGRDVDDNFPSYLDIVSEWVEPHPAESWPEGCLVAVSDAYENPLDAPKLRVEKFKKFDNYTRKFITDISNFRYAVRVKVEELK